MVKIIQRCICLIQTCYEWFLYDKCFVGKVDWGDDDKTQIFVDILSYFFQKGNLPKLKTAQRLLEIIQNVDGKVEKEEVFEDT